MDRHHPAGKNNNPATVQIPANDHRAELTRMQMDWPKETRENLDQSPLLRCAANVRGYMDMQRYSEERFLQTTANDLEEFNAEMTEFLGSKWWQKLRDGSGRDGDPND